uniref:Uncharacterized protein n=1 Tax=Mycena chlorophos TaxID=658473 RepID=A0ABQ0L5K0_MYCCL|nr:predicted protein [Mycena chlorophos]
MSGRRNLPKPQPSPPKKSVKDRSSTERPPRAAKSSAYQKTVWLPDGDKGAAPADDGKGAMPEHDSASVPARGRKRAGGASANPASKKKKATHVEAEDDDAAMFDAASAPTKSKAAGRSTVAREPSPQWEDTRDVAAARRAEKAKAVEDLFDDDDNLPSEHSDGDPDFEDEEPDEGDVDLDGLEAGALTTTLSKERPQWSTAPRAPATSTVNDDLDVDEQAPPRKPTKVAKARVFDSDSDDDDVRAGKAALKVAQALVPPPRPQPRPAGKQKAAQATAGSSRPQSTPTGPRIDLSVMPSKPTKVKAAAGKRNQTRRDTELPSWTAGASSSSAGPSGHSSQTVIDLAEDEDDDGDAPLVSTSSPSTNIQPAIYMIYENRHRKVNLTDQSNPVQDLFRVGLGYLFGILCLRGLFLDYTNRTQATTDSLTRSARSLGDPLLLAMLRVPA